MSYFEFTKISWSNPPTSPAPPSWCPEVIDDQPPFPASKQRRRTIDDYLTEATGGLPAQSAIAEEIRRLAATSEQTRQRLRFFSIATFAGVGALVLTAVALVVTALALAYASYDMLSATESLVQEGGIRQEAIAELRARVDEDSIYIRELRRQMMSQEAIRVTLEDLRSQMEGLRNRLEPSDSRSEDLDQGATSTNP